MSFRIIIGVLLFSSMCLHAMQDNKLPIVFHKNYDISFMGLENLHPFDSKKYGKAFNYIRQTCGLQEGQWYTPDAPVTDEELLKVHTPAYLNSLKQSAVVAQIAELPSLAMLPNAIVRSNLLTPMLLATKGTLIGAQLALQYGWAINLSGGYHHAKAHKGEGFCVYADIPLAAHILWETNPHLSIMIVDLDAHQGNGHEAIFKNDPRVSIFDIYNEDIYPHDTDAKKYITFNHPVHSGITGDVYLALLKRELPKAIAKAKPNLIIYNGGTDILAGDPLGYMQVNADAVIERDAFVFRAARDKNIPILMVLSGGYTKQSAQVIGKSVANIISKQRNMQLNNINFDEVSQSSNISPLGIGTIVIAATTIAAVSTLIVRCVYHACDTNRKGSIWHKIKTGIKHDWQRMKALLGFKNTVN